MISDKVLERIKPMIMDKITKSKIEFCVFAVKNDCRVIDDLGKFFIKNINRPDIIHSTLSILDYDYLLFSMIGIDVEDKSDVDELKQLNPDELSDMLDQDLLRTDMFLDILSKDKEKDHKLHVVKIENDDIVFKPSEYHESVFREIIPNWN